MRGPKNIRVPSSILCCRWACPAPIHRHTRRLRAKNPMEKNRRSIPPPATNKYSRSEEHTSELQSRPHLVCRLLLEKKKNKPNKVIYLHDSTAKPTPPPPHA